MADSGMAPGKPGISPTWCSSAKDVVTTALGSSQIWATIGYGIINEVYWPSTGHPQIRDLGFIVAGNDRWYEVKRVCDYTISTPAPNVPIPTIIHRGDDYELHLEIVADDVRDVLLIRYQLAGDGYQLYPLLAPRLGTVGRGNSAWVGRNLMARRDFANLCLSADRGFSRGSAGYVGRSDGWQDFSRNGAMMWTYSRAEDGNVALMGELAANEGVLAMALAPTPSGAETLARSSLAEGFDCIRKRVMDGWQQWGNKLTCPPGADPALRDLFLKSAMVLKVCDDRHYPGAVVASLSIPWGNSRDDLGGYHLVWARDCVEAGLGLLAAKHEEEARRMAAYLIATQQVDGHWTQNFYPDGLPYWTGIQLDEVAFPVLLFAKLQEEGCLDGMHGVTETVRRAVGFLARSGPVSPQDRWEENQGINPFTLAVEIAALVAAAEFLPDDAEQQYALSLADYLNRRIEDWLYVKDSPLAAKYGVAGYYLRIASTEIFRGDPGQVIIANRGGLTLPAESVVSLDYLYLSRLGIRRADSPEMLDTLKIVDGELQVETPNGVSFRRYNEDGYGEHADGSAFDGSGLGRAWPLLTGERGHYAIQLGADATPYLEAMAQMTGPGGLIPEQVWDSEPIDEAGLQPGKPSGSAMPLLWAHAEFVKLLDATERGEPIELLDCVRARYQARRPEAKTWHWRVDAPFLSMPKGVDLLIEAAEPFRLHFGFEQWQGVRDQDSTPGVFGMHTVRIPASELEPHDELDWTSYFSRGGRWEGRDHSLRLIG